MKVRKTKPQRRPAKREGRAKWSLSNPPVGFTISVEELAELTDSGINQAYEAVRQGIYPSIRSEGRRGGKGAYRVLTVPTLAILRGELPPGPPRPPGRTGRDHRPAP